MLPVKTKRVVQRERYFYYYLIEIDESFFFEKRTQADIWKNLYQFPLYESEKRMSENELLLMDAPQFLKNCELTVKSISGEKKHLLSHRQIFARVIHVQLKNKACISGKFIQVNKKDIAKFAVPRLLDIFINELDFFQN